MNACREKYGNYVFTILQNILKNSADAEECVNDVWLAIWNTIPPKKPASLKHYLAVIARNIGVNRYAFSKAVKRNGQTEELLEEIAVFTPTDGPEEAMIAEDLKVAINNFLEIQEKDSRICFVLRYFYSMSYRDISLKTGKSEHNIVVLLSHMRNRLQKYLISQGYEY